MKFVISDAARLSFSNGPTSYEAVTLIRVSTVKVRLYYSKTDEGQHFFAGPGGVEKFDKLAGACDWIKTQAEVWAPVIDMRSNEAKNLFFANGRHTFIALERSNQYPCIEIVVPQSRHEELQALLCCDHT